MDGLWGVSKERMQFADSHIVPSEYCSRLVIFGGVSRRFRKSLIFNCNFGYIAYAR